MREGFFIEAGAYDGEGLSNTLFLELKRNVRSQTADDLNDITYSSIYALFYFILQWTGLLVEPNPDIYPVLAKRNRNANLLPHCLSTQPRPEIVQFDVSALIGGIIKQGRVKPGDIDRSPDYVNRPYRRHTVRMQCFPIYSILMALGNPTVHYFSLDIEGAEFPVLKTIPWDKVDIRYIYIYISLLS